MHERPSNDVPHRLIADCRFGEGVVVFSFTNLYGCIIGDGSRIGTFVEVQDGVEIGANCKIQSHSFICSGVKIGAGCFVGHGVVFVNDKSPAAINAEGNLAGEADWEMLEIVVHPGASIGSGAVILGGVEIGRDAMIGAGSIVGSDVPPGATVRGEPARAR